MGITLRHDAAAVGTGGGEEKRRFGQQLVMRQLQNAQENKRIAEGRRFELGRMAIADQLQQNREQRMLANNKELIGARADAQFDAFKRQRELQQEDMQARMKQDRIGQNTGILEARVAEIRGAIDPQNLTPQGQQEYKELFGALRAIQAQRDTIEPLEYNKKINEWLDKYQAAGLGSQVKPPPTVDEEMKGRFKPFVNERGEPTGYGMLLQPDGKMEVREIDPMRAQGDPAQSPGPYSSIASDPKALAPFEDKAREQYKNRWMQQNPDSTSLPPEPSPEELAKITNDLMKRDKEYRERVKRGAMALDGVVDPLWPAEDQAEVDRPPGSGFDGVPGGEERTPKPGSVGEQAAENFSEALKNNQGPASAPAGEAPPASAGDGAADSQPNPYAAVGVSLNEDGRAEGVTNEQFRSLLRLAAQEEGGFEMPSVLGASSMSKGMDSQEYWNETATQILRQYGPKDEGADVNKVKDGRARTWANSKPRVTGPRQLAEMVKSGKIRPGDYFVDEDGMLQQYAPG